MLQRQIMFKQLEELQRQQKLQELNGSRQQNLINQQSLVHNKQAHGAQYAPLINGTPVRDASQMFMFGNTNLVQGYQSGLPFSQAQNQVLHSMGVASQPVDGHGVSQFFHLQGETRESVGDQADTLSKSCMSDQFNVPYQDRNLFGPALSQTEIDQQEFGKGQEQDITNPSQESTSLDPLERKFLYDTNDDNLGGFGNMFEDIDKVEAVPSLQNGSWSALMQSALEETSSTDTGVQEEWSGLSFQNPEMPSDNQPSGFMESGKNLTPWQNNSFQTAPSSKASNAAGSSLPGFQQSHKEAGEFEESTQVQRFSPLQVHQGNDALNNGGEFKKDLLSGNQRHSASDVTSFRGDDSSDKSAIMDKSAGFSAPDLSSQTSRHMLELLHTVDKFRGYKHGTQPAYTDSDLTTEMPKAENTDAFTPFSNSSGPQYAGLVLGSATRPSLNYFNLSQISQQADNSHLVPLKYQDGRRSLIFEGQQVSKSTKQPNAWVDMPSSLKQTHISPLNPAYSDPNTKTAVKNEKADSDAQVSQPTPTPYPSLQDVYSLYGNSPYVQMNLVSTSQYGRVWPVTGTNSRTIDHDLLLPQSKKRKFPTYELLPWHKEATKGSSGLQDMSTAEVEWAQAAKRVPEMLKEETEALGASSWRVHSKKRVILTTQLMQVLFRPAPAALLSDDASKSYNTLTYFAARLALGDACSLSNHLYTSRNTPDSLSGKSTISKGSGDKNLSKIVEDFIKRAKELENDLLRLESGGSLLEIRMELQDLERFAVINRFAKFHSRTQVAAADAASSGGASTAPKLYPQRYVKAIPMPMTVPQGYNCLSL